LDLVCVDVRFDSTTEYQSYREEFLYRPAEEYIEETRREYDRFASVADPARTSILGQHYVLVREYQSEITVEPRVWNGCSMLLF